MIKKKTKVIFEDGNKIKEDDLIGGMPLSKGEIVHIHKGSKIIDYKVARL
ncbi:MAG: hypothetical protein ABIH72_01495 [archaeon]